MRIKFALLLQNLFFTGAVGLALFSLTSAFAQTPISFSSNDQVISGVAQFLAVDVLQSESGYTQTKALYDSQGTVALTAERSDFPRIGITAGTTITVDRFGDDTPWNGEWEAPQLRTKPAARDIVFVVSELHESSQKVIHETYQFGASNEVWGFEPRAEIAFRTELQDGTELFFAFNQDTTPETWTVKESARCIVTDGLCRGTVGRVDAIAIVQELWTECPAVNTQNAFRGAAPYCRILCENGFQWNEIIETCERSIAAEEITLDALEAELNQEIETGEQVIDEAQRFLDEADVTRDAIEVAPEPVIEVLEAVEEEIVAEVVIEESTPEIEGEQEAPEQAAPETSLAEALRGQSITPTDVPERNYTPPRETLADTQPAETDYQPIAVSTPDNNIQDYIRAAGALLGVNKEQPTQASLEDIYRVAGSGEGLPVAVKENRLPHAGVAPFVVMGIAGFGLLALSQGRRRGRKRK